MNTRKTVQIVDIRLAKIEVISQGEGPVIILLPSLGRGAEDFDEMAGELANRNYRVLRPQPRGIGNSTGAMSGIDFHNMANDVAMIAKRDGATSYVVAGHAYGQKIGRTLAADHPQQVKAVIMLAGAGRAQIPQHVMKAILASGDLTLPDEQRIEHLKTAFFAPGSDPTGWLKGWYPATKAMQLEAERATPLGDYIGAGSAPILDVQAELDTVVPVEARQDLKNELGDRVTIKVIANAGHALLPEQLPATVDVMDCYLKNMN